MIESIETFEKLWAEERGFTGRILAALTDASLSTAVGPQDRTLARIAWHLVTSLPEMMERTGLKLEGVAADAPVPASAAAIASAYEGLADSLGRQVRTQWSDETLQVTDDMYGETWKRGATLLVLILHQTHHRGQMTVLMRQAGLKVPGVYGPAREDWAGYGMTPPAV